MENYLNKNQLIQIEEEMASIGKWLAYTIMFFVIVFLILAFFNEGFLDKFIQWTLKIIYAVVGGAVIYVVIKYNVSSRNGSNSMKLLRNRA